MSNTSFAVVSTPLRRAPTKRNGATIVIAPPTFTKFTSEIIFVEDPTADASAVPSVVMPVPSTVTAFSSVRIQLCSGGFHSSGPA